MEWNETLQCGWDAWIAVNETHVLLLVPEGNRPDMTGCIKLASALMPGVQLITVVHKQDEQTEPVCQYQMLEGRWRSLARPMGLDL